LPTKFQCVEFVKGLFIPFVPLNQVLRSTYPENPRTNMMVVACYTVGYASWVVVFLVSLSRQHLAGFATTIFLMTGGMLGLIRLGFRTRYHLRSNYVADWMASTFLWPQVLAQMRQHDAVASTKVRDVRNEMDHGDKDEGLCSEDSRIDLER
jgi:Cys-rich protein (TIGR01571 family)